MPPPSSAQPVVAEQPRVRGRRRTPRWPLHAEVEVIEPVQGAGVAINGSTGGMRFAVDCGLSPGQHCLIRTRFVSGDERVERARVVWTKELRDGWIVGVQFLERN